MKTPIELNRTKKDSRGRNKTQVVAFSFLERLPGTGYCYFLDNLFVSERFLEFLRSKNYGATRIYRINTRVISELIDLKKQDQGDKLL